MTENINYLEIAKSNFLNKKVKVKNARFVYPNLKELFEKYNFVNTKYNDYDDFEQDYVFDVIDVIPMSGFNEFDNTWFYYILDNNFDKERIQLVVDDRALVLMELNNDNK